jgi:hypothetical protein
MCGPVSFQWPHKQCMSAVQCDLMVSVVMCGLCGRLYELLQLFMSPRTRMWNAALSAGLTCHRSLCGSFQARAVPGTFPLLLV